MKLVTLYSLPVAGRRALSGGFTLIETMVAVTLLTVAIVAPMSLASQSLQSAYYARDQITASNLAQEGVEAVRAVRDHNILLTAYGTPTDILNGIPVGSSFRIDPTNGNRIDTCSSDPGGVCEPLYSDGTLYGYTTTSGWLPTQFTRTVMASYISGTDEVKIQVTVSWQTGSYRTRSFTISDNLFRWVNG